MDDCSTDETAEYLASLATEPEVSAYRRVRNSGFMSNYAFAMQRARGRYAVFLGDDDLLIPEKVVEYVRIMENDPAIGMVQAPWLLVDARPGGGDTAPFYNIPAQFRHAQGDFESLLTFILERHVFPEFMIVPETFDEFIAGCRPDQPRLALTETRSTDAVYVEMTDGVASGFRRDRPTEYEWSNISWLPTRFFDEIGHTAVYEHLRNYLPLSVGMVDSYEIDTAEDLEGAKRMAARFQLDACQGFVRAPARA